MTVDGATLSYHLAISQDTHTCPDEQVMIADLLDGAIIDDIQRF
jgi:hypothetical protein